MLVWRGDEGSATGWHSRSVCRVVRNMSWCAIAVGLRMHEWATCPEIVSAMCGGRGEVAEAADRQYKYTKRLAPQQLLNSQGGVTFGAGDMSTAQRERRESTRMKNNRSRKDKGEGDHGESDDTIHRIDTSASPRHITITKLAGADHKEVLPEILSSIRCPQGDYAERRRSSIVGLSRLRDLAYDADNKRLIVNSEYGALEVVLNMIKEDKEEARCKATPSPMKSAWTTE